MGGMLKGMAWGVIAVVAALAALSVAVPPDVEVASAPGAEAAPDTGATGAQPAAVPAPAATAPDSQPAPQPAEATPAPVNAPDTSVVNVPPGSAFNRPPPEKDARLPATDGSAAVARNPGLSGGAPSADSLPAGTRSADVPQTASTAPQTAAAPESAARPVAVPAPGAAPAPGQDSAGALRVPGADAAPTVPAQAAAPQGPANAPRLPGQGAAPAAPATEAQAPTVEQAGQIARPDAPDTAPATPAAPETPLAPSAPQESAVAEQVPEYTPQAPSQPVAEAPAEESAASAPATRPAVRATPGAADTASDEPGPDAAERPGILRLPVPGGGISAPNVRVGRLPTIGGEADTQQDSAASDDPGSTEEPETDPATLGALARYAVPFERQGDLPLFSVALIYAGSEGLDLSTLQTFTFPVTFVVDPTQPGAADAARELRRAGFEVVLLAAGLPDGAAPKDLEVTLGTYLADFPETVAVMTPPSGPLQSNRPLLRQLMQMADASGHGVLTYDRGLNTAEQIARSAGVPSAMAFRVLDAERESAPTIGRYLDRAAFKAAQDGYVVMVGHSYADTVTALFTWALEGAQGELQLAPLSAILRGQ